MQTHSEKQKYPVKTHLREDTIKLFNERSRHLSADKIAEAIGVSVSWLNAFGRRSIANPGVITIETLNAYLKENDNKNK